MHRFNEHPATFAIPKRLNQLLLLAIAITGTGASVVALSSGRISVIQPMTTAAVPAPARAETQPTLLPAVVVRPDAPIPTLAAITVRPDRLPSTDADDDAPLLEGTVRAVGASVTGSLAGGALGMPYYSFGKTTRHASKE